jgi:hypothetical protein
MIREYLVKKSLDAAFDIAAKVAQRFGPLLRSTSQQLKDAVSHHINEVDAWSSEISFADLHKAKLTDQVFVPLDLYLQPRRMRIAPAIEKETVPFLEIVEETAKHLLILGQAGAGKTTSMKFVCHSLLHEDRFCHGRFSFPLVVRLRELNNVGLSASGSLLVDHVMAVLGLHLEAPPEIDAEGMRKTRERTVVSVLDKLGTILILDGFDELEKESHRDNALRDIRRLARQFKTSLLILTSRTGNFVYSVDNTETYELSPLQDQQLSQFALKWLGDRRKAASFVAKLRSSPFYDATLRPLTLSHLCAIYERIGMIPEKPKTVYRKIVNLLLEEWDQQRSVSRRSRYAHFEVDRKFEFLCNLSYVLTTRLRQSLFSRQDLGMAYNDISGNYDLPASEMQKVVNELETHTGLFVQTGYDSFEFAHKSLQEYLAAEYIVKLPSIPDRREILLQIPSELALAVAISSNPSAYLTELIMSRFARLRLKEDFIRSFLARLLIEKPEFNKSNLVCIAFVRMYSAYIEANIIRGRQLMLFYEDRLFVQFEQVVKQILRRNANVMKAIPQLYSSTATYGEVRDAQILKLAKKVDVPDMDFPVAAMPEALYFRREFLNEGGT